MRPTALGTALLALVLSVSLAGCSPAAGKPPSSQRECEEACDAQMQACSQDCNDPTMCGEECINRHDKCDDACGRLDWSR
jgi:hypothetical protein